MTMLKTERDRIGPSWTASGVVYVEGGSGMDTVATQRSAERTARALGDARPRDAIDPVNSYFRRVLECPRQLMAVSRSAQRDSVRLDSVCNYR